MTTTSVPASATSVLLKAADGACTSLVIENTSPADLYILMDGDPATTVIGGFSFSLPLNGKATMTPPESMKEFNGIWSSAAGGGATITALTTPLVGDNTAIQTYGELKEAMADWLRPNGTPTADMTASIPKYIGMCEAEMNRRLYRGDQYDIVALTITDGIAPVPTGFRAVQSMKLTDEPYTIITFGDAPSPFAAQPNQTSTPIQGRRVGTNFVFEPPTSANASLIFKKGIVALEDDADTNWLLAAHPDAYLYGSLVQAGKRLGDERLSMWQEQYETVISQMIQEGIMATIASLQVRPSMGVV